MELYNAAEMPLSSDERIRTAQMKFLNGQPLTLGERIVLGRDTIIKKYADFEFKPDHCYRAVSAGAYEYYMKMGMIMGASEDDEYEEYMQDGKLFNNNRGVDWYLGGACLRYGDIIIECPADKEYFQPAFDNGNGLSADPSVKFMKSSGFKKPIPMSMITRVFRVSKGKGMDPAEEVIEDLYVAAPTEEHESNLSM